MTDSDANATSDLNNGSRHDSMLTSAQTSLDTSNVKDTHKGDALAPTAKSILPPSTKTIDSTQDESAPAEKPTTAETTSIPLPPKTEHVSSPSDRADERGSPPWHKLQAVVKYIASRDQRELGIVAAVVGLIFARCCLRWMNWTTIVVAVLGMGFGGFVVAFHLLAVPEATRLKRASAIAKFGKFHDQQYEIVDGVPEWSKEVEKKAESSTEVQLTEIKDAGHQRVCIAPDIDPMVEEMISYTLRDFVNVPMGLVSQGQHNVPLRASLVAMAMNVSSRLSNMRLPETALLAVFGLQNNFIVHLRAYRELRASKLPIADYVSSYANPDSVLGRCYHKEERLKQFRSTAKAVCQALLSKNDQQSVALFAVMQEIMATHVLESTLDHVCDPDYINLSIIDYFTATTEEDKAGRDSVEPQNEANRSSSTSNKPIGIGKHTEEAAISALADSILMNAAHLMDKSAHEKQGSNTSATNQPVPLSIPQHTPPSPAPSATDEVNAFDRMPPVEASKAPPAITLKSVLTNKSDHIDLYQEFMSYLQVWDAMDLAQFWLMIDIFHRQIEQGTLSNLDDLRREASSIFESYCGPDPDENVAGIREAKGGALLKNLKKKIDRDPANCFVEAQEWALSVLEGQYWIPFEIKKENERQTKSSSPSSQKQSSSTPRPSSSSTSHCNDQFAPQDTQQAEAIVSPTTPMDIISPSAATQLTQTNDTTTTTAATAATITAPVKTPQPVIQSIHLSDMVNRRPKTLMSNTDLSYMVEVQTQGGQGWMVTRTFQQLEQFQLSLVQQFPMVQRVVFPRWRLQPSDKVCTGLDKFLVSILAIPEVAESEKLAWFLSKEYDQESGPGLQRSSTSGLISAFSPVADQSAALGAAAAQGAKTAFRQASEASLSAGRFFKSLGAAVGNTNSSQLAADDRSSQGSFESVRSVRSVSNTLTLSEQQPQHQQHQQLNYANGVSSPLAALPRSHDSGADLRSRVSSSSESTRVSKPSNSPKSEEDLGISSLSPTESDSGIITGKRSSDSTRSSSPGESLQSHPSEYKQPRTVSAPPVSTRPSRAPSMVASQPTPAVTASTTATSASTSEPTVAGTVPTSVKKSKVALLSNDELDLLIETSFTVLEDMMDFSKGQSIRRMTFGMLRELVRKSYRVAINESFSAWVESNTSHENAVEMVRWMKDDFFWPNGEWPTAPAPTSAPTSASTSSPSTPQSTGASETKKDIIHIGEELYEIGEDGIAVKVSKEPMGGEAASAAPSPSATEAPSTRTLKEKEETREKARELVKMMLPGSLVTVLGREAVLRGLMDVFEMFQIKELNLGLALSVLEMVVRLVLTR
ncbi:hypothetical protein BGZ50_002634 [Haplosporangium sp. Z 11]|nr:hypothetical protein BGZ50_002634 [Haplosporangium sp. Z 11]